MGFTNASSNTFPPTTLQPLYRIWRDWCIGDSLGYMNDNFLYLETLVNTLSTGIPIISTGATLQRAVVQESLSNVTVGATSPTDVGLSPATITSRIQNNSKILIELTGGRYTALGLGVSYLSLFTWFYVSENGGSYGIPGGGSFTPNNSVEYVYSVDAAINAPHCARFLYTPSSSVNSIAVKVYAKAGAGVSAKWNNVDAGGTGVAAGSVPITLSVSELKV